MTVRAARLCALLAALAFVAALVPSAASASSGPRFRHYVALGDSYAAGPLIPLPRLDPLGCVRSTNDYPALLARRLGILFYKDVTCSGADTTDMTNAQSIPLGSHPPQFQALTESTDLVSVSIGGNDYGVFGTLVGTCPGLRDSDPTGSPCREQFTENGVDTLRAAIDKTQVNVTRVLEGVRERAPLAKVLVVGYPRIVPATGYCEALPLAQGDYSWADSLERALNAAVAKAAADTGSTYVDTYTPSLGHDICAGSQAWVNGKDLNLLAAAPYHPFYSGMAAEAAIAYGVLTGNQPSTATVEKVAAAAHAQQRKAQSRTVDPGTARLAGLLDLRDGAPLSPTARQVFFPVDRR